MSNHTSEFSAELWRLRARRWTRYIVGILGFTIIGYALLGIYQTYETARAASVWAPGVGVEEIFMSSVEGQLVLFAVGVAVVYIAAR